MANSDWAKQALQSAPTVLCEYIGVIRSVSAFLSSSRTGRQGEIYLDLYNAELRRQGSATLPISDELLRSLEAKNQTHALRSNLRLTLSILPA